MAEWLRVLDLKSGGPWFKSFTLLLSGFVFGSPEFNSSTALCKWPTGQLPLFEIFSYLFTVSLISTTVLNTYDT